MIHSNNASDFSVDASPALDIKFGEEVFIHEDSFETEDDVSFAEAIGLGDGEHVYNAWKCFPEGALNWRREVSTNGKSVEVTFWLRERQEGRDVIEYGFLVSSALIEGASYKAICGRQRSPQYKEGTFCEDTAKQFQTLGLRYLWFDTKDGGLWLDLDPRGVWAIDYSPRYCAWTVTKRGRDYLIKTVRSNAKWGHTIQGKFVVGSGDYCYPQIHPKDRDLYSTPLACCLTIDFGPGKISDDKTLKAVRCGTAEYSSETGLGWETAGGLAEGIDKSITDALRQDFVEGNGGRTFVMTTRPGWYLMHLVFADPQPENLLVRVDAKRVEKSDELVEDHAAIRSFSVHAEGTMQLRLEGERFRLAGIMLQPLLYDTEDYTFSRSWWRVRESDFPISYPAVLDATGPGPPPQKPDHEWAWDCVATNWTVYNNGDREQFASAERAGQRARQLCDLGFNAVNISGEHFRYNLADRFETIAQHTRLAADACRKYGIKTIEHHEFTIPQVDGYRRLEKDYRWLQRDVLTGRYNRWFCINNPEFRQKHLEYLLDFQQRTDVDGYMLDEIAFCGIQSCGCKHCRKKFTEETGEIMPSPVPASMVGNFESDLWRRRLVWRTRAVGETNNFFRDALKK